MELSTEVSGLPEPTALAPVANQVEDDLSQATAAEGEGNQPQEQAEQTPKTFTQEEVDALIQKRLTKEARRQERATAQREQALRAELESLRQPRTPPKPTEGDKPDDQAPPAQTFQLTKDQLAELIEAETKKRAPQFAQQQAEQERQQAALDKFWERADELSERFPDFDGVVKDPGFKEMRGAIYEFCMESEQGPEVAYHLAKNRALARQIDRMGPMAAARALVSLEGELKAKPKAQPSKAPDPINPVGNRGTASRSSLPSDEDDIDTWMRKERERMAKLSRR